MTFLRPLPCSSSQAAIFSLASVTDRPFRKPEFTRVPVATSVKASLSRLDSVLPFTTSTMGRLNFLANSQSRVSWAGTAMMAPVP